MIMLGVLGEYLWRVLDQSRKRPMYVIDRVFDPIVGQTESQSNNNITSMESQ
jgi:hypothetical protein